ncbi:MAG TPA: DUF350 domain-containing protein [Myxococcaceae bacterium]|nr:DUF350 domain-containing protein [Myxococcaceae bacterium]
MPEHTVRALIEVVIFSAVGITVFAVAFFVIARISPFSLRKELEDDQNTALGVVIGSMIIGLSLIISAAIHG